MSLVKDKTATSFDGASTDIVIHDSGSGALVSEEDPIRHVIIQFGRSVAWTPGTDTCTEDTKVGEIRLPRRVCLKGGLRNGTMPQPVLQVDRVEKREAPEPRRETSRVKQCTDNGAKSTIQSFNLAIHPRRVGASGLNDIASTIHSFTKSSTSPKLTPLIDPNSAIAIREAIASEDSGKSM